MIDVLLSDNALVSLALFSLLTAVARYFSEIATAPKDSLLGIKKYEPLIRGLVAFGLVSSFYWIGQYAELKEIQAQLWFIIPFFWIERTLELAISQVLLLGGLTADAENKKPHL